MAMLSSMLLPLGRCTFSASQKTPTGADASLSHSLCSTWSASMRLWTCSGLKPMLARLSLAEGLRTVEEVARLLLRASTVL
jgi:hypothetical protein